MLSEGFHSRVRRNTHWGHKMVLFQMVDFSKKDHFSNGEVPQMVLSQNKIFSKKRIASQNGPFSKKGPCWGPEMVLIQNGSFFETWAI